jgi:hypothetical protein
MRDAEYVIDTEPQIPAIPPTLRSITPEDTARATLNTALAELGSTEVHVLTRIAERLTTTTGRAGGALCAIPRARTFLREEAQREIDHALVFLACAWIKAETLEVTR